MALGDQTRKCAVTINGSTEVTGSHTDYTVFVNHAKMPPESLDADGSYPMNSDGGDIRVFSDAGLTVELPRDIIYVSLDNDPANSLFLMSVKLSSLTTSNKNIYVAYNDSGASDYARSDTYGRDNAYDSNWKLFYPMVGAWDGTADEIVDRTVNANDGQGGGGTSNRVPTRVAYEILYGQDYDDIFTQTDYTETDNSASINITGEITMGASVNRASGDASTGTLLFKGTPDADETTYFIILDSSDKMLVALYSETSNQLFSSDTALTDGVNNIVLVTWDGTTDADAVIMYLNGSEDGTGTKTETNLRSFVSPFNTGSAAGVGHDFEGTETFVHIHNTARGAGWADTYRNNVSDIANFLTTGTPEDIGDGTKALFFSFQC